MGFPKMGVNICVSGISTYIAQKESSVKYENKIHLNKGKDGLLRGLCLTVSDLPRNECFTCDW